MSGIDPFKLLGKPSTWGKFGEGAGDEATDAERRAICDFYLRRLAKLGKRNESEAIEHLLSGAACAYAGLFVSSAGGPDLLPPDAFDHFIAVMTFAWYQAIGIETAGAIS